MGYRPLSEFRMPKSVTHVPAQVLPMSPVYTLVYEKAERATITPISFARRRHNFFEPIAA